MPLLQGVPKNPTLSRAPNPHPHSRRVCPKQGQSLVQREQRAMAGVSDLSLEVSGGGPYNSRRQRSRVIRLTPGAHVQVLVPHLVPLPKYFTSKTPETSHL